MICERPGCTNDHAELSRIGGITRRMCFDCTKELVMIDRERRSEGGISK